MCYLSHVAVIATVRCVYIYLCFSCPVMWLYICVIACACRCLCVCALNLFFHSCICACLSVELQFGETWYFTSGNKTCQSGASLLHYSTLLLLNCFYFLTNTKFIKEAAFAIWILCLWPGCVIFPYHLPQQCWNTSICLLFIYFYVCKIRKINAFWTNLNWI